MRDAMKGQSGDLCLLVGEAEQVRGPARVTRCTDGTWDLVVQLLGCCRQAVPAQARCGTGRGALRYRHRRAAVPAHARGGFSHPLFGNRCTTTVKSILTFRLLFAFSLFNEAREQAFCSKPCLTQNWLQDQSVRQHEVARKNWESVCKMWWENFANMCVFAWQSASPGVADLGRLRGHSLAMDTAHIELQWGKLLWTHLWITHVHFLQRKGESCQSSPALPWREVTRG